MVRKIQKTFDWEVMVRCLAAATVVYVVGSAVLRTHASLGAGLRAARGLAG